MKYTMSAFLLIWTFMIPAYAGTSEDKISIESCAVKDQAGKLFAQSFQNSQKITMSLVEALEKMKALDGKPSPKGNFDQNKPWRDQVSPADAQEDALLNGKIKALRLSLAIENQRMRDMNVIPEMVRIADSEYRWQENVTKQGDEKYPVELILAIGREAAKQQNINFGLTQPAAQSCSLDTAIYLLEFQEGKQIADAATTNKIEKAAAIQKSMEEKYGSPLNKKNLSADDRKIYGDALNSLKIGVRIGQFVQDLELIRALATASNIWYETDKQDLMNAGGDPQHFEGVQSKAKTYDAKTRLALNWWTVLDEKIPSELQKSMEASKHDLPKAP